MASSAGWHYDRLLDDAVRAAAGAEPPARRRPGQLNFAGVTTAFSLKLKVALFVGVLIASPVWLYQMWAFIVPGLTRREKRDRDGLRRRRGAAVPRRLLPRLLALPKAVEVLLGFTPTGAVEPPARREYLDFVTRFILAFGLAFLLPVFLVGLNVVGTCCRRGSMLKGWRSAVMLIFVFAAIDDPDPRRVDDAGSSPFPMVAALLRRGRRRRAHRPPPAPATSPTGPTLPDDEAAARCSVRP